jgi:hypothetical protein
MTLLASSVVTGSVGGARPAWTSQLDSSSTTALEQLGVERLDWHPIFGDRKFKYVKFTESVALGEPVIYQAPVALTATAGSTTSVTVAIASVGLYDGYTLSVFDDAGAAGAAPEGQVARVKHNTTTGLEIEADDAFSVAVAVNDVVHVSAPWAVSRTAGGEIARLVAGVALSAQDAADYGWVQTAGGYPSAIAVAAGTALTEGAEVVVGARLVTAIGAGALNLAIGTARHGLASDTVLRTAFIDLTLA